jgi:hypothetical protein
MGPQQGASRHCIVARESRQRQGHLGLPNQRVSDRRLASPARTYCLSTPLTTSPLILPATPPQPPSQAPSSTLQVPASPAQTPEPRRHCDACRLLDLGLRQSQNNHRHRRHHQRVGLLQTATSLRQSTRDARARRANRDVHIPGNVNVTVPYMSSTVTRGTGSSRMTLCLSSRAKRGRRWRRMVRRFCRFKRVRNFSNINPVSRKI